MKDSRRIIGILLGLMALAVFVLGVIERDVYLVAVACFARIVAQDMAS